MSGEATKELILDKAEELFFTKGFDATSMSEIQEGVQIARGTLYHHFKSKEKIMDSIIDRKSKFMIDTAQKLASEKSVPALERFKMVLAALNQSSDNKEFMEHLHAPQNSLMHEKTNKVLLEQVVPILSEVITDGVKEGVFDTPYPFETMEMIVLYANFMFDYAGFEKLSDEAKAKKTVAFYHNLQVLLGLKVDPSEIFNT